MGSASMRARAFDFTSRVERELTPGQAADARAAGDYVWLDLGRPPELGGALRALGLDDLDDGARAARPSPADAAVVPFAGGGLRFSVAAPGFSDDRLVLTPVVFVLSEGVCITSHDGPVGFLDDVWEACGDDFRAFARTPGFLLYEFWDHLIAAHRRAAEALGDRVRLAQDEAFAATGDSIFAHVAALSRELLTLRRAMVAARETLAVLATRRSAVVPKTTRPYLRVLAASLDRLVADLAVEREILAETLNLYIGLVGHRTNQVVNRLTVVSFVFLPLTFLCGVYGMNFEVLPELRWRYGYLGFWAISAVTASALLIVMKRRRWF